MRRPVYSIGRHVNPLVIFLEYLSRVPLRSIAPSPDDVSGFWCCFDWLPHDFLTYCLRSGMPDDVPDSLGQNTPMLRF